MPAVKGAKQDKATIAGLKDEFIAYYKDCPVQKYAAMAIGRSEVTICDWKDADEDFRNRVDQAKAFWVKKKLLQTRAEFGLERLEKEIFAERTELTGKDGDALFDKIEFTYLPKKSE